MLEQHYRTLGVPPGASLAQVKSAYRKLVQAWHPDRHGGAPHLLHLAEETLKDANLAYRGILAHMAPQPVRSGPAKHAASPASHPPAAMMDVIIGAAKRLAARIRTAAHGVERRREPGAAPPPGAKTPASPAPASRQPARQGGPVAFETVLGEVAGSQGLRVTSADPGHGKRIRRLQTRRGAIRSTRADASHRDDGPVSPVAPVGPVAPGRRQR